MASTRSRRAKTYTGQACHTVTEVLLLTGHASVETSIEGMKLGAFDYLLKSMKFDELLLKLASALEKKAAHENKIRDAKIQELTRYPSRVFEAE